MLNLNSSIKYLLVSLFSLTLISVTGMVSADENNGLKLQSESRTLTTYLKPGVNLKSYKSLNIEEVTVEFKNKWLDTYNRNQKSISNRLNDKDLAAIKSRVAKQFHSSFAKELEVNGGYKIVQSPTENTLLIKPSIVDLVINGPEKNSADFKVVMVRSAGKATLVVEIYDTKTGQLLGKMVNKRETHEHIDLIRTNRVVNRAEFIPVYRTWAKNLQKLLQ